MLYFYIFKRGGWGGRQECLIATTRRLYIHIWSPVTCHISHIMRHLSCVTCHMSPTPTVTATDPSTANSPIMQSRLKLTGFFFFHTEYFSTYFNFFFYQKLANCFQCLWLTSKVTKIWSNIFKYRVFSIINSQYQLKVRESKKTTKYVLPPSFENPPPPPK